MREQIGLRGTFLPVMKVGQPHPNQPVALRGTNVHSFPKAQSDVRQLLTGGGRRVRCLAASQDLELAGLQLQNYRPRNPRFLARGRPDVFCEAADHWLGIAKKHILLKGVLSGYRLCRPVRHNRSLVDTKGEFVQAQTEPAELSLK